MYALYWNYIDSNRYGYNSMELYGNSETPICVTSKVLKSENVAGDTDGNFRISIAVQLDYLVVERRFKELNQMEDGTEDDPERKPSISVMEVIKCPHDLSWESVTLFSEKNILKNRKK